MGQPIQFRRGNKPNLPNLNNGEPAFVQDEKDLYVGTSTGNQLVGGKSVMDKFDQVESQLAQIAYIAKPVDGEDFGAVIQNLYNTIPDGSTLKITEGTHEFATNLLFDRPIDIVATKTELIYTGTHPIAIEISRGNTTDLKVKKENKDWENDFTGLRFRNINQSTQMGIGARNFKRGIVIDGNDRGNSYNKYFINSLWDNKESLVITSSNGGWANENMFFGGRFAWTSGNPTTEGNTHILIDYVDYSNNSNKFYGCSLESASDDKGYAIKVIQGRVSTFRDFRYEGVTKILISEGSIQTTIDGGYGLVISNIEDLGGSTYVNTQNKLKYSKAQSTEMRNNSSATGSILDLINSLGAEAFKFYGDGNFTAYGRGYIRSGIDMYSETEEQKRFIRVYNGDPEGFVFANQGSLIMDRRGYLYIKSSGMETNTGWKKVLTEDRA